MQILVGFPFLSADASLLDNACLLIYCESYFEAGLSFLLACLHALLTYSICTYHIPRGLIQMDQIHISYDFSSKYLMLFVSLQFSSQLPSISHR